MTFYCVLPNDENIIRTIAGFRVVGRYLIVNRPHVPPTLAYASRTIIVDETNREMQWWKHQKKVNLSLSYRERKALTLQILKSEVW